VTEIRPELARGTMCTCLRWLNWRKHAAAIKHTSEINERFDKSTLVRRSSPLARRINNRRLENSPSPSTSQRGLISSNWRRPSRPGCASAPAESRGP
jgi:hypothetical protein